MNAVRGDPDVLDQEVWKFKKNLAQALVSTSHQDRHQILADVVARTAKAKRTKWSKRKEARHTNNLGAGPGTGAATASSSLLQAADSNESESDSAASATSLSTSTSSTAHSTRSGSSQGSQLEEGLMEAVSTFVERARAAPSWRTMGPVLEQLVALDPHPPVSVNRDGSAAEVWVRKKLAATLPAGWELQASGVITRVCAPVEQGGGEVAHRARGIKGEVDALLLDPQGLGQGVVEVKIGGSRPYASLYNDLRKLKKLMKLMAGCDVTFEGGETVRIPPTPTPCYLVVTDQSGPLDGSAALVQAEQYLVKLNVSMALGTLRNWQSTRVLSADAASTRLQVAPYLVQAMTKRLAKDFYKVLSSCEVYEIARPVDARW